jgi:tetratricopeptide (TPR) repeat protein
MMGNMRTGLLMLILLSIIAASAMLAQQAKPIPTPQTDLASMLQDAQSLYRKGSFDLAIARYNEILKVDPQSGDAYAGIVRCYLKQDKVHEADDALQKGLQANPGYPDFKVAEGELLFREGEIPEAGRLFDEVIATPPSPLEPNPKPNARAYLGAARVAGANAMHAREHIMITRAHAIDASDPDIRKKWMQTLSAAERIQSLQEYLGQSTNDDSDTRRTLQERVDFLKASQSAPAGRCRPVSDVTATKTNLVTIQSLSGLIQGSGLDVNINGKPSRLLLDTGASGILISGKLAALAGLKPVSDVRLSGVGNKPDATAHVAYAESVRIGEMEFRDCTISIVDRFSADEDGLIGTDVFSQFLIELDFPGGMMRLSQLPTRPGEAPERASLKTGDEDPAAETEAKAPANAGSPAAGAASGSPTQSRASTPKYFDRYVDPEMHSYVQAFRIGHMLLVPTKINEGTEKLFLLDTGAFDNTISLDAAQKITKVHRAPRRDIRGLNGEVKKVFVADQVKLDFGHIYQTVPDIIALDLSRTSRQTGTEISGTLGMVMLKLLKVRLDYRDALVDFQYVPNASRRR